MNELQIQELFKITEDTQKYGSIRLRFPLNPVQNANQRYSANFTEEPSAEEREIFFRRLNTPYEL